VSRKPAEQRLYEGANIDIPIVDPFWKPPGRQSSTSTFKAGCQREWKEHTASRWVAVEFLAIESLSNFDRLGRYLFDISVEHEVELLNDLLGKTSELRLVAQG
jgi:hypothetical protein